MRALRAAFLFGMFLFGSAHAAVRYTDARIIEIETGDQQIHLFLQVVGGDAPPVGNGGTNVQPARPYVFLANTSADINARKHMFASALAAHASGATVVIRWDDTTNRVEYFLVRN